LQSENGNLQSENGSLQSENGSFFLLRLTTNFKFTHKTPNEPQNGNLESENGNHCVNIV
jgi:hypothetical protein